MSVRESDPRMVVVFLVIVSVVATIAIMCCILRGWMG